MLNYKLLLIAPAALLVFSLVYLVMNVNNLQLDIDLKGGTQISLEAAGAVSAADVNAIEGLLKDFSAKVRVGRGLSSYSIIINVPAEANATKIISLLKGSYDFKNYSVQTIGPVLGAAFFRQAQLALMVAFILMAITVFAIFREPFPSFYVVLCGFADIVEALVFSQLLGINLSLASFAALLLLVGYSVDTDILLTTRVLKGGGESEGTKEKIKNAMKTGLTMSLTTISAVAVLLVVAASSVLTQIASVLLIGLVADILNTWVMNAGLLRWHMEKRSGKNENIA